MLVLYQFQHSAFCLKVRMALRAKKLSFRTVEVTPGIGQIKIFRLSGQKQLPVLVDGENVISDSSEIIQYLECNYPETSLIPSDPKEAGLVHLLTNWSDTTLAKATKKALIKSATLDQELLVALLPNEIPIKIKNFAKVFPGEIINRLSNLTEQKETLDLEHNLEEISKLVKENNFLIGDSISIADIAIAAQLSLIKFPFSAGTVLAGKGCKRLYNNSKLISLFTWRDNLEKMLMIDEQKA